MPDAPRSVKPPPLPATVHPPSPGRWLWTCRAGFEGYLYEELAWLKADPELLGPGLLQSRAPPKESPTPAFARMAFPVGQVLSTGSAAAIAGQLVSAADGQLLHVQGWCADTPLGNTLGGQATALAEAVQGLLPAALQAPEPDRARGHGGLLAQLCLLSPDSVAVGLVPASEALSLSAGGRQRMRREAAAPSRAAMKLEEALECLPVAPGRGDVCVDLGAAPGGWTERLLARGARVEAVDPARMAPHLEGHGRLTHHQDSAFAYEPQEPVDWLCCDMAWRPLEVASLLAKWGRKGWALHLLANIKLPMNDKNPILHRVRQTLMVHGNWRLLWMRQLYHDRDEVTVAAVRRS